MCARTSVAAHVCGGMALECGCWRVYVHVCRIRYDKDKNRSLSFDELRDLYRDLYKTLGTLLCTRTVQTLFLLCMAMQLGLNASFVLECFIDA